jgi:hypothetical protein
MGCGFASSPFGDGEEGGADLLTSVLGRQLDLGDPQTIQ